MTAEEYLSQARRLDETINSQMRELEYWRKMAASLSGMKFDGMPHSPNRSTDAPFVRCIEKIDEIQRSVGEKTERLISLREEIMSRIEMLESSEERLLLRYRYIDGLPWREIERVMGISKTTAHRIRASALENFHVPD